MNEWAPLVSPALHGKVCLVTGASQGLGATIARTLAVAGAAVAVHYNRSERAATALCAELAANGANALPVQADLLDAATIEPLATIVSEQLGPIDILVNNVGPYVDTPFLDLSVEDFDLVMNGNVRATFLLSQYVGRRMRARGAGRIINIAATDYRHRSHSVYGLAKGGVIHLTEALALELAPQTPVFALAPDLIADNEDMAPDFVARAVAATPMRRLVTRAEIAAMVALLCTPVFDMMTGQTLVMDGGRSLPRMADGDRQ
ncbi:MAG: 2-deoxy-D-gluconate 3-dehydrogenase [Chloroflexota bacterium]|jgi:NAD(P)-dependent dehydrogenase (short-subunit alcohol dehydrogenase family)|nr:SDR family oxidoreductase [Caldilinea sp.]GIK74232.1 MAG: 2-deoxy-D-gluconate 3-dehydrogenase [Chloroflexota bacterium]